MYLYNYLGRIKQNSGYPLAVLYDSRSVCCLLFIVVHLAQLSEIRHPHLLLEPSLFVFHSLACLHSPYQ